MPGRVHDLLRLNPTLQIAALVETSRRGVGRRHLELTDPRAVAFLLATLVGGGRRRLDPALRRRLRDAGVLVHRRQVPRDVHLDARLRYLLGGEPRRRGAPLLYDEPLLDFLGAQLTPIVAAVTGDRAQARSPFLRLYDPGAAHDGRRVTALRARAGALSPNRPARDARSACPARAPSACA